jgi:glutamine---fructose-6-phosphate transaminase (isomerizing)
MRIFGSTILQHLASARLPIFGIRYALACGVIGLVYKKSTIRLGEVGSRLLKVLEYRGYDSTGGAFQNGNEVTLLKAAGAPSEICQKLGMPDQVGSVFCGQVRWATYGAVDDINAQPHVVRCKRHIYGAHNGNISNSPQLKVFLQGEGHSILSDNDGEMLVHIIEHNYDLELNKNIHPDLESAMRAAIIASAKILEGSYAAVIVIPETKMVFALKGGSSLYVGIGKETPLPGSTEKSEENPFIVASSDLTAVLRETRLIIPIVRDQFIQYDGADYTVYAMKDHSTKDQNGKELNYKAGEKISIKPHFSRLQASDIGLREPFTHYMEQEISDEVESARRLVRYFLLGSERLRVFRESADHARLLLSAAEEKLQAITISDGPRSLRKSCETLFADEALWELFIEMPDEVRADKKFYSDASNVLELAWKTYQDHPRRDLILLADIYLENDEINQLNTSLMRFVDDARRCIGKGGQVYAVCSGTSYNAARTGALFFNDLGSVKFVPLLPGEYRGQFNHCIDSNDLLMTISQSGETKDVIDVVDDLKRKAPGIKHISLVNNVNSTLGQEKADYIIPLRCGPEIAVPATKSFINQLTMLYGMALYLAAAQGGRRENGNLLHESFNRITQRSERLEMIPELLSKTLETTDKQIDEAAELLYLAPSLHILATRMWGVAREGALKIREVVLNHAEGIEATEFKHGPNTILGLNTSYGIHQVQDFAHGLTDRICFDLIKDGNLDGKELRKSIRDWSAGLFENRGDKSSMCTSVAPAITGTASHSADKASLFGSLYRDYPLIYVTGPGKRDVELTITQINTHKIRGAMTIVIAEQNDDLKRAALEAPADNPDYKGIFIELPKTGDLIYTTFTSIMVLQRLALKMCLRKMDLLDNLGVENHGVHPDSPKNVSKSITVD